jgi:hypothetical protein
VVSADAIVELDDLRLEVEPLLAAIPIGAPVRLTITLRNVGREYILAPSELTLKAGHVSGSVTDPAGGVRSFRPLVRRTDRRVAELAPAESRRGSMTLLRGGEGHLFPFPGSYTVEVRAEWELDGVAVCARGETSLMILPAADAAHAEAALRIMQTPDAVVTLALGGDHLEEGIAAIQAALDNDVLRPHYAYIEAKRLAAGFKQRTADPVRAAQLVEPGAVMSDAEAEKAAQLVRAASNRTTPVR